MTYFHQANFESLATIFFVYTTIWYHSCYWNLQHSLGTVVGGNGDVHVTCGVGTTGDWDATDTTFCSSCCFFLFQTKQDATIPVRPAMTITITTFPINQFLHSIKVMLRLFRFFLEVTVVVIVSARFLSAQSWRLLLMELAAVLSGFILMFFIERYSWKWNSEITVTLRLASDVQIYLTIVVSSVVQC